MLRENARETAIRNAMAHNNCLKKQFLNDLPNHVLICFVHPEIYEETKKKLKVEAWDYDWKIVVFLWLEKVYHTPKVR